MSHLAFKSFHERNESNQSLFDKYETMIREDNWNLQLSLSDEVLYAIDEETQVVVLSSNDTLRVFHNENDAVKWMECYRKVMTA